jgi:hypothetical protein
MEHTLKLGESLKVGGWGITLRRIIYAGEVSAGVFSIVAEWSAGYNSAAYNLYFRENQGSFPVLGGDLTVLGASQHELRFRLDR